MADIRLKKITIESNNPLTIQNGSVLIIDTTNSLNSNTAALIVNGGISIRSTSQAISSTSGGALTILGGAAINTIQIGDSFTQDTSVGIFRIKGITYDRVFVDTSEIQLNPDSTNLGLNLNDKTLKLNMTTESINRTTGSLVLLGGVTIQSTYNSTSLTAGGNFMNNGGGSFLGNLKIGSGIESLNSNTIGNIKTSTSGNVGIGVNVPVFTLDVNGLINSNTGITTNNVSSTNISTNNANFTNISSVSLNLTGISTTNILASNGTITTLLTTNGVSTNITTSTLVATNTTSLLFNSNTLGNIYTTGGNVGINVTSPGYRLDVSDTFRISSSSGSLVFTNTSSGNIESRLDISGGTSGASNTTRFFSRGADTTFGIFNVEQNRTQVSIITNATVGNERIYLLQDGGNIGIGSLTANATLDITGTFRTSSSATIPTLLTTNHLTSNISTNSVNSSSITTSTLLSTNSASMLGSTNTLANIYTVSNNVGISNTNPAYTLDINGTLHSNNLVTFSNTSGSINSSTGALVLQNGGLSINTTQNSTSLTNGGSVTISGGMSILRDSYFGGIMYIKNSTSSTNHSTGSVILDGGLTIRAGNTSITLGNGGDLTVLGGSSFGGDVYVGGSIFANSSITNFLKISLTSTEQSINASTGSFITNGGVSIRSTANATSITNGGSLTVNGGGSVSRDLYIGGSEYIYTRTNYVSSVNDPIVFYNSANVKGFSIDFDSNSDFSISRYDTNSVFIESSIKISKSTGIIQMYNSTSSTGTNTASLLLDGGISIRTTTNAVNVDNGGGITNRGGLSVLRDSYFGGNIRVISTTDSVDTSTGSFIIDGGAAVKGNVNIGGNTLVLGNLSVRGTTTSIESVTSTFTDNIISLNAGPTGSKDAGVIINRYQVDNNLGDGDVVNDQNYLTDTLPLQTGMTSVQVKLSGSASNSNNFYNGWWIKVTSGFSNNQVRKIISYDGTTKIATISSTWTTQNPSNGDIVFIYNKPYVCFVFNEINDRFELGSSATDSLDTVSFTDNLPLFLSSITCVSTDNATGISSGSILTSGGITITSTQNATSLTNGGTFISRGGGSFGKDLLVGGELVVSNVNITPEPYDIVNSRSFNASNNIVVYTDITSLIFSCSGFDLYLVAVLNATTPLYCNFHIRGVYRASSWEIIKTYVGDDTGIDFFMTTSGQLQYTTANYPGFVSLTFTFRAITI